jgi:hypothetical protein
VLAHEGWLSAARTVPAAARTVPIAARTVPVAAQARRSRGPVHGAVLGAALLVVAAAASGCGGSTLYPASLEKLPPKNPPANAAPAETPEPEDTPTETQTPDGGGIQISCATLDIDLPDDWNGTRQGDGIWVVKLPKDTGGGTLQLSGSFDPGAEAKSEKQLQALVRGKDGDKVPVQVNPGGVMVGRLAVKKGSEWRLAQSFEGEGTQSAKLLYSPAGNASNAKIQTTAALLEEAASKAELRNPGECSEVGG